MHSVSLANREFSIRQFILLVRVTPCKFVDSADLFYAANKKRLFTTRQVEFRFVRLDECKILCPIWHIVFSIRKLHLISDNDPLQVCRFDRFVLFDEWKISFTTWQVESRFVRFDERKILCSIWHIVLCIRKLHLINDNDPCKFVDSANSFDSAKGYFYSRRGE